MKTCEHLFANKEKILKIWEQLSLAKLPEAQNLSRTAIRDHIPEVFTALCHILESGVFEKPLELSKTHGRQRSWSTDYSLAEVMGEYAILKNVIFDELSKTDIGMKDFRLIDRFFDSATSIATTEFVASRERELNNITDSLVTINQELETFASVAAHDLRSPASTIISFADLISEEESFEGELAAKAIDTIKRTASRMLELIDQLLEYSKIGKEHLVRAPFSLKTPVTEAIDNLTAQIKEAGAEVHVAALPDYQGDPILFRQLFQNLISNSIKFRSKSRVCKISVSGAKDGGYIRVRIKDNGSGFDPKLADHIFQPFKRGTNRTDIQGSGLGLATAKKIVELHGGKITGKGEIDIGAEIIIELPVQIDTPVE
jgi:signal transduction histidine kinase